MLTHQTSLTKDANNTSPIPGGGLIDKVLLTIVALFSMITALSFFNDFNYDLYLFSPLIAFVAMLVWIARRNLANRWHAYIFGYVVALKFTIIFNFGAHFAIVPLTGFFATMPFWVVLGFVLICLWMAADCRSYDVTRVLGLTALTLTSLMANQYLGELDVIRNVPYHGMWGDERILMLTSGFEVFFFEGLFYGMSAIPLVLGALIAFCVFVGMGKRSNIATPTRLFNFSPRSLLFGQPMALFACLLSITFVFIIIGLFTADNSAIVTGVTPRSTMPLETGTWLDMKGEHFGSLGQNRLIYHILQFDAAALAEALNGMKMALPFILAGCFLVWIASRYQLTGLVPILVIGALCGLGWHFAYPNHGYWTPFMTTMQSAILIGMICAAGFGAVAQLVQGRSVEPTSP